MNILLFGGTGQIGGTVARELLRHPICSSLTLIGRREAPQFTEEPKIRQVILDTSDHKAFEKAVAQAAKGHDAAICCIGIGSGTLTMSQDQILAIEVHLVDRFARGCKAAGIELFEVLTAVGSRSSQADSKIPQVRALGLKHKSVVDVGFEKLAIFQPGMIVGNAHTPVWITWFTRFIPDALGWGNIDLDVLAKAFVAHLADRAPTQSQPVVCYGNREMKHLVRGAGT